jgi:hypothetical protein
MKSKAELNEYMDCIRDANSPVGMDALYVHAVILEKLEQIEKRLDRLENTKSEGEKDTKA